MGFFKNLFSSNLPVSDQPNIQFGRFSDSFKDEEKYDAWDKSLAHFEKDEFLASFKSFFNYLKDDDLNNVEIKDNEKSLIFKFYQGSKVIHGKADHKSFYAEAKIAKILNPNIGVFRKLLEDNYQMKYSRYAVDDEQNLTTVFSTYNVDGSPYKLYYALKELATTADRTDDILVSKYQDLESINTYHVRAISEEEKTAKYDYLRLSISEALDVVEKTELNISQHPGAVSYIYLDLIYRIDYLLKPEGYTMDIVAKLDELYFKNKIIPIDQKNLKIKQALQKIANIPYTEFKEELYEVNSTFGTNSPSGQTRIKEFIKGEIGNMTWYMDQGHDAFALSIPSYIVGYSLYSYSMPAPLRALMQLFYRVTEYPYFDSLGFQDRFVKDIKLDKGTIKKAIQQIILIFGEEYTHIDPNYKTLDFDNILSFSRSYMIMIEQLDFTRKDMR